MNIHIVENITKYLCAVVAVLSLTLCFQVVLNDLGKTILKDVPINFAELTFNQSFQIIFLFIAIKCVSNLVVKQ